MDNKEKYIFRLNDFSLENFKALSLGKISLAPQHTNDDYDDEENLNLHSEIIGFYGPNGSGKSSVISAFELVKSVLLPEDQNEENLKDEDKANYQDYIRKGSNASNLSFTFTIFKNNEEYGYLSYSFDLKYLADSYEIANEELNISFLEDISLSMKTKEKISEFLANKFYLSLLKNSLSQTDSKTFIATLQEDFNNRVREKSFIFDFLKAHSDNIKPEYLSSIELVQAFLEYLNSSVHISSDRIISAIRANKGYTLIGKEPVSQKNIYYDESNGKILIPVGMTDNEQLSYINYIKSLIKKASDVINSFLTEIELTTKIEENGYGDIIVLLVVKRNGTEISLRQESYGVRKIINLSFYLPMLITNANCLLVVDEFDEGIFEYLLGSIFKLIKDRGKGQLLFTAHNLRPLEYLNNESICLINANLVDSNKNQFKTIRNIKSTSNLRNIYLKALDGKANTNQNQLQLSVTEDSLIEVLQ